jgi:hypothetical protein
MHGCMDGCMDVDLYSRFPKCRRSLILILFLTYSQIWPNLIVNDGHVGYITKLKKKKRKTYTLTSEVPCDFSYSFFYYCSNLGSVVIFFKCQILFKKLPTQN